MMELADPYGRKIFETISVTLVCGTLTRHSNPSDTHTNTDSFYVLADDCLASEHPELCRHKMSSMPRWLSSQKVEIGELHTLEQNDDSRIANTCLFVFAVRTLLAEDPVRPQKTNTDTL